MATTRIQVVCVCKQVVANHHGWLKVESKPDQGASFRVYLLAIILSNVNFPGVN